MPKNIYEQLFYQSSNPQIIYSEDFQMIDGNQAFYEFFGFPQQEWIRLFLLDVTEWLPENKPVEKRMMINESEKLGIYLRRVFSNTPLIKLYHIQVTDITDRVHSERMYRLIAENSLDVINIHRLDGSYIYASPAVKEAMGYEAHELMGKFPNDFVHIDDRQHCDDKHMELLEKKQSVFMTYRIIKKDGTHSWLESAVKPIIDPDTKEISEFISISRNIDERIRANEILQKSEKLAIIGRMSAAVAHEIRNPLTPIKGFIQLFQMTKEYNENYGKIILAELQRVENIISEFLTMAKPHHEKVSMIDISQTMEKVIQLLETEAILQSKTIECIFEKDEKFLVQGDPSSLKQVFINVIQNALDAIKPHSGRIQIFIEKADNESICIKISDNGTGIEKERLLMLGEPFYSTKEKGIGLGLMTSFRIIENHHGKISFASEKGIGTEVTIALPQNRATPNITNQGLSRK
ncbi:PAS domain S-box protein [Sutcliffiella rhizosphaerae]|uniref:histidine kinase n=1 Tax=Sutcliffiella rhizosphaerae TaxID=2880967 RepID=A0ABN8A518_9BACI|nr:PAS domain S-box protein [Sutcliffiella rhizosphaerae]CAG9620206.1 Adaptive-response sensory-kinase SasA [Sutcliffiella rhizosphaerae]